MSEHSDCLATFCSAQELRGGLGFLRVHVEHLNRLCECDLTAGPALLAVRAGRLYVEVRGLTEVWELKGEGSCWKGFWLCPSGVEGEAPGRTRPTGWMAPGRVWNQNRRL